PAASARLYDPYANLWIHWFLCGCEEETGSCRLCPLLALCWGGAFRRLIGHLLELLPADEILELVAVDVEVCGARSAGFQRDLHAGGQAHLPSAFYGGVGPPCVAERSAGTAPDGSIRRVLLLFQLRDELVQRVELLLELLPSRLGPHGSGLRYERLKRVLSLF